MAGQTFTDFDFVVYGGTLHGLAAACYAADYGMKVVVLEWTNHKGGTRTGGLGVGDYAIDRWGRCKQFGQWTGSHAPYNYTDGTEVKDISSIEAKAAMEAVYTHPNVTVKLRQRIRHIITDPATGDFKMLIMENDDIYVCNHWHDGSYEVDMAFKGGIPCRGGRDGQEIYDEPKEYPDKVGKFTTPGFNPGKFDPEIYRGFDSRGDRWPNQTQPPRQNIRIGDGDPISQSYGWRFSLKLESSGYDWVRPSDYTEADARRIVDMVNNSGGFGSPSTGTAAGSQFPLGNSTKAISGTVQGEPGRYTTNGCDLPGIWTNGWCEKTYDQRIAMQEKAAVLTMGSNWVVANDARIPLSKRTAMKRWRLPDDEWVDDYIVFPGMPGAYYIRDGRSIVGQFMMTLDHVNPDPKNNSDWNFEDSVGGGGYHVDIHAPYFYTRPDGYVQKDGSISYAREKNYGIPLRCFLPDKRVCGNLSVSWGASGSTGWRASFRMEETVMCCAQSIGVLHGLAFQRGVKIGEVPVAEYLAELDRLGCIRTV